MPSQYRYRGSAFGAAAVLTTPFNEILPTQASANLADFGGYGCGRSEDFRHRDFIHFDLAHSEVTGSQTHFDEDDDVKTYSTLVRSTITNLNVMGMIECDKIVANLVSTYEDIPDAEPSIRLIGSRFQNLMIAGIPVKVCLNLDVLDDCHQHNLLKSKFKTHKDVRDLFGSDNVRAAHPSFPDRVKKYLGIPPDEGCDMPGDDYGVTTVSIVRKLEPECNAFKTYGHVVHIEGFGTIRLGEVRVTKHTRQLSMIQVELGCPVEGQALFGSVDGGTSKGN